MSQTKISGTMSRKSPRIRLVVSAAFFPHFSRNLNTGELETVSAMSRKSEVRVHHDRTHPSAVTLPVIP